MCGITGIVSTDKTLGSTAVLRAMADAIVHRGPDDCGYYETTTSHGYYVGLGHRRLSIIDLESGKQPITNEDQSVFLVFNGEIYNFQALRAILIEKGHIFTTHSDSEVIVHAYEEYGEDCVSHFRGMFAFAIWDDRKKSLFLARDRFGKKPLFYKTVRDSLLFSSEIKSFLALPAASETLNTAIIQDYLVYRYVPGPGTLFSTVHKLEPGSYATFRDGVLETKRYYFPPDKKPCVKSAVNREPVDGFMAVLRESVSLRMISDVPFGAFLSGGIDSSAVVALMTECSELPVKTFSVGFSESDYSELRYAETVARHFGTDHHELTVSHEELIKYLPDMVRFRDAPVSEPSDIPIFLLSKEASKTVKMVLTGEGSDEMLGGYPKHVFERYARLYQLLPSAIREHLVEPLINLLPYGYRRVKTAINTLGIDEDTERQPRWFGAMSYRDAENLLALQPGSAAARRGCTQFIADDADSPLRRILYFDQTSWLPDNLLERGDRMTMAASIEARMPFMDHELAEYVSGLPDRYRVRGGRTKWILREAMKDLIPAEILNRKKVGFRLPVNEWFRGAMKDYLYENLTGSDSLSNRFYRQTTLKKVLKEHEDGRQNHEKLLWTLLNLELWLKQNEAYFQY